MAFTVSVTIGPCSMSKSRSVIPVASTKSLIADARALALPHWLST